MRLYYALDLKDDPALIAEYERWHRPENVWPDIVDSIRGAGVRDLDIFRAGNRLVLVLDVDDDFSAERKAASDAANPRVQEWEALMWKFQQALPFAKPGEKWLAMHPVFSLSAALAARENRR
ncbi:MAG: L-rhamnose mutarotase [Rudaea sp.]|uniref:L-rhamnose mutarotase n=1 Tax=Rudaea sp. TaxID=2136325 RepID=UPI0039E4F0FD